MFAQMDIMVSSLLLEAKAFKKWNVKRQQKEKK